MADLAEALTRNTLYDTDFYEWTQEQARLLRDRRFADLDLENLIDEVQSVGNSERREVRKRLIRLISHLLKWKYQPGRRGNSWRRTIRDQRREIDDVVAASPSLRRRPAEWLEGCYDAARLAASDETGIDFTLFPEACPFTIEEVLDSDFLPLEPDLQATTQDRS